MTSSAPTPWYRQFWPWMVFSLPASAVAGCLVTIWLAVAAAPERVDFAGATAVSLQFVAGGIEFTPPAPIDGQWPATLELLVRDTLTGQQWARAATLTSHARYSVSLPSLDGGAYEIALGPPGGPASLLGHWSYPAPVWKVVRR